MLDNTRLYAGVKEALDRLRDAGSQMAVLTNKPVRFSRELVDGLGLGHTFSRSTAAIASSRRNRITIGVETLLRESGIARERTIMVGDSGVDIRTARNANIRACGVTYGFQPEGFAEDPPDLVIDDMNELADYVLAQLGY